MNESSPSSFYMVLLFVLRCLVPLGILFGISYLLRRMGLVVIEKPEPNEGVSEIPPAETTVTPVPSPKLTRQTQSKKPQKRKVSPPRKKAVGKKTAAKTKTETSRSRS